MAGNNYQQNQWDKAVPQAEWQLYVIEWPDPAAEWFPFEPAIAYPSVRQHSDIGIEKETVVP